jgi:hypothetical protein
MHIDRILHFRGTNPVPAHIQYIIHTPSDAIHALFIAQAAITREIQILIRREIGLPASFVIAIGGAKNTRPRKLDAQVSRGLQPGMTLPFSSTSTG